MAISFVCTCGKTLRAPDEAAGKRSRCPVCGETVTVPTPEAPAGYALLEEPPAPPEPKPARPRVRPPAPEKEPETPAPRRRPKASTAPARTAPARPAAQPPWVFHHFHWLFCLALIPLVVSLVTRDRETVGKRLKQALKDLSPEQQQRLSAKLQGHAAHSDEDASADAGDLKKDLFDVLPQHRLPGAMLPYGSGIHWLCALAAAFLFLTFILLTATEAVNPLHLLGIGVCTGTVGIVLLIAVQWIADWTQGYIIVGRSVLVIAFWVLKFIGFSYRAAMGDTNFFLSFIGFTFGVGFCEELCKALPLLAHFLGRRPSLSWRGAMFWGLASGTGFGIAEGIMYSSDYYNGIAPVSTYLIRFLSCVALHALWTGSVGIMLYRHHGLFHQAANWVEKVPPLFLVLGISMLLHGLYDTMLKKDLNALALVVALASFGWFAWQVHRMTASEEDSEPAGERGWQTA
ncbi:MAG TPA: PrsW family glutamic-type intramembrane protease [Gemmataceae bacterium]|nr:PrsW family glutamic-type intramembrane protease [Gemmataceae bacterium]